METHVKVLAVLYLPGVVVGIGLLKLRPWARVLGIVVSALTLLHSPYKSGGQL